MDFMDRDFRARLGPWIAVVAWLFAILLVLMLLVGASLEAGLWGFFNGAFGGRNSAYLMTTIGRSALIIGMALAVLVSFRAGLYNIGGEGQLVVGGIVAALGQGVFKGQIAHVLRNDLHLHLRLLGLRRCCPAVAVFGHVFLLQGPMNKYRTDL